MRLQINQQQWPELDRLLDEALDLPHDERDQWFATLDPKYASLKPHLQELLLRAAHGEPRDFLGTLPKLDDQCAGAVDAAGERAGGCIGPYRLIRELGVGGMGSVWLAERIDGLINRPVALKLPHGVRSAPGLAQRMARERDIHAALGHANIARLFDAGFTAEGRPFLALEFVEGCAIDEYCRRVPLDLKARLGLFLQVANAVAYAHAQLIIHRDLKPTNILVTETGDVRLLDFGVAALLEQGQAHASKLTELSGRALTLRYASPEQVRDEPLSTATDIYSLGVVLYELLTESPAYRPQRDTRGAIEEAILNCDPQRPSVAAATPWRTQLKGDLDTILLKTLKKRPEDRYATVNELVDDVIRYLRKRPVLAQPDSYLYRARKLVVRNKFAVAAAFLLSLTLLVGASAAVHLATIAGQEKRRAEEVNELLIGLLAGMSPYAGDGRSVSARRLLESAADNVLVNLNDRIELKVRLLAMIGSNLLYAQETDAAERVLSQAIAMGRDRLGPLHRDTLRARVAFTTVRRFRGDTAALRAELLELTPALERDAALSPELIVALRNATHLQLDTGEYPQAIETAERAAALASQRLGPEHPDAIAAEMMNALAQLYGNDPASALRTAERMYARVVEFYPADALHPRTIEARAILARALSAAGDFDRGMAELRRAIADAGRLFGPSNRMVGYQLVYLAQMQLQAGRLDGALEDSAKAVEIVGSHSRIGSTRYAKALSVRAQVLLAAGRAREAARLLDSVVDSYTAAVGAGHALTREAQELLARASLDASVTGPMASSNQEP